MAMRREKEVNVGETCVVSESNGFGKDVATVVKDVHGRSRRVVFANAADVLKREWL